VNEFTEKMDRLALKVIKTWINKASRDDTSTPRLIYMNEIILELVTEEINVDIINKLYDMYDARAAQKEAITTLNIAYPSPNTIR